jgi:oligoendopeptidase F
VAHLSVLTQTDTPKEWDLSELYKGFNDPKFEQDLQALQQDSAEFRQTYRGCVNQLTPEEVNRGLYQLENLAEKSSHLETFATLIFCGNAHDAEVKQFFDRVKLALTGIQNQLLFFNLELQELDPIKFEELQAAPVLENYSHYLNRLAQFRNHTLPEIAEQTRNRDILTGRKAFLQLYSIHRSEQNYEPVTTPDGKVVKTEAELEALLFYPDATVRYDAYCSLRQEMQRHIGLYGLILNTICQDYCLESQMRGYPATCQKQLLEDELPESVFRQVMDGIGDRIRLFQKYYQLKANATQEKILTSDRFAPWTTDDTWQQINYKTAVSTLLDALKKFDVFYANRAADLFSNKWIDAQIRVGKGKGVFCFPTYAKHSYLSLAYTEDFNSLLTLAHNVGSGLHLARACERQTAFNRKPPLLLTEVAANFNKLLLFDYLFKENADHPQRRQVLLTRLLEDWLNQLFHNMAISRLELAIHGHTIQGSFDAHFVNEQWLELYRNLCGDVIEVLPEHQYDWVGIRQLYVKPFSCYQYAAAGIASLACYQQYQESGKDFIGGYLDLLSAGGSLNQIDALRQYVGIDLEDSATIDEAMDYLEKLMQQL